MADLKISQMTEATTVGGTDLMEVVQSGSNFKAKLSTLATFLASFITKASIGLGSVDNVQQLPMSYLDTDGALAANSDTRVASQKAVKAYADALIAANDAMVFKGSTDCSASPNYPAADRGHTYRVSVAGKIGGASGIVVEAGDMFICLTDGTAAGAQAAVGSAWSVIQTNLDGAVIGPASATSGNLATFSGTTGKLIQDSGKVVSTDGTLSGNSDNNVPTEKAVKTYAVPKTGGAMSGALQIALSPSTGWALDTSNNATGSVANGSNFALPDKSGLVIVNSGANGDCAAYLVGAAGVVLLGSTLGTFVAPTTTPASGKSSIAWSGSHYTLYNNTGGAVTYNLGLWQNRAAA